MCYPNFVLSMSLYLDVIRINRNRPDESYSAVTQVGDTSGHFFFVWRNLEVKVLHFGGAEKHNVVTNRESFISCMN